MITDDFNTRLINTELGYMEIRDKPTPIATATLVSSGHTLKQAGRLYLSSDVNSTTFKKQHLITCLKTCSRVASRVYI